MQRLNKSEHKSRSYEEDPPALDDAPGSQAAQRIF